MNIFGFLRFGTGNSNSSATLPHPEQPLDLAELPATSRAERREASPLPGEIQEPIAIARTAGISFKAHGSTISSDFQGQPVLTQLRSYSQLEAVRDAARRNGFLFEIVPSGERASSAIAATKALISAGFKIEFNEQGVVVDLGGHSSHDVMVMYTQFRALKVAATHNHFTVTPKNMPEDVGRLLKESGDVGKLIFSAESPTRP